MRRCLYLHVFYIQYVSIKHTLCCYFFEKTKVKSKNESREKECVFFVRARRRSGVRKPSAERLWVKSRVLVVDSPFEKFWVGETQLSQILARLQHSSQVQKHSGLCDGARARERTPLPLCARDACASCSPPACAFVLFCVCVFDRGCVFSDSRGLRRVGPSVWEQSGGANDSHEGDPR